MLTFTLIGSVNGMHPSVSGDLVLGVHSQRPGGEPCTVITICRARPLIAEIQQRYGAGDRVRIQGELEPRCREIGGMRVFDVLFIIQSIERISPGEAQR
jgi:hypothetical protein